MTDHPEFDLLSAYIDGELNGAARTGVEAHVASCLSCSAALNALRRTIADVQELGPVLMTEHEIAALDAHLAGARTASVKPRWLWAAGVAAASILAVTIGVNVTRHPRESFTLSGRPQTADSAQAAQIPFQKTATDYSSASAKAALLAVADGRSFSYDATTTSGEAASKIAPASGQAAGSAPTALSALPPEPLERCVFEVRRGSPKGVLPVRYEQARYNGSPAFLLFFKAPEAKPERIELWIMRISDCYTLYFTQRNL